MHFKRAACAGRWGRPGAWLGERVRRAAQLNHWAAFPPSFARGVRLLRSVAEPPRRGVIVLSGDVHYSYAARVRAWPDGAAPAVPVHQLVSSPLCYDVYRSIAGAFRAVVSKTGDLVGRLATRAAGAPRTGLRWTVETGPWLNNIISTVALAPEGARVRFERTRADGGNFECQENLAYAVTNPGSGGRTHSRQIASGMAVRRLTPREVERLFDLPDDYTLIPYRGKPAKDGPRYRALGNSFAVPVVRWIGERIQLVEGLYK